MQTQTPQAIMLIRNGVRLFLRLRAEHDVSMRKCCVRYRG